MLKIAAKQNTQKPGLGMMAWLATDGGRRCPICGRFARPDQVGYIGGNVRTTQGPMHVSAYGHLPGYGCNK